MLNLQRLKLQCHSRAPSPPVTRLDSIEDNHSSYDTSSCTHLSSSSIDRFGTIYRPSPSSSPSTPPIPTVGPFVRLHPQHMLMANPSWSSPALGTLHTSQPPHQQPTANVRGHELQWSGATAVSGQGQYSVAMPNAIVTDAAPSNCNHCGGAPGSLTMSGEFRQFRRCARCKKVDYCSEKCQRKAWKHGHKTECKALETPPSHQTEPPLSSDTIIAKPSAAKQPNTPAHMPYKPGPPIAGAEKPCSQCGAVAGSVDSSGVLRQFRRCKGCKTTDYCSEKCQRRHWEEKHKSECAPATIPPLFYTSPNVGALGSMGWGAGTMQVSGIQFVSPPTVGGSPRMLTTELSLRNQLAQQNQCHTTSSGNSVPLQHRPGMIHEHKVPLQHFQQVVAAQSQNIGPPPQNTSTPHRTSPPPQSASPPDGKALHQHHDPLQQFQQVAPQRQRSGPPPPHRTTPPRTQTSSPSPQGTSPPSQHTPPYENPFRLPPNPAFQAWTSPPLFREITLSLSLSLPPSLSLSLSLSLSRSLVSAFSRSRSRSLSCARSVYIDASVTAYPRLCRVSYLGHDPESSNRLSPTPPMSLLRSLDAGLRALLRATTQLRWFRDREGRELAQVPPNTFSNRCVCFR